MRQILHDTFASAQAFQSFGLTAGQALAGLVTGSESASVGLKRFFFNLIGDLAIQFGQLAILAGTAANAMPWFGLTGTPAVIAGILLTTFGGLMKGLAGAVGSGASGGAGASVGGGSTAPGGGSSSPSRAPRTPRIAFGTSGESPFDAPVPFLGGGGGGGIAVAVTIQLDRSKGEAWEIDLVERLMKRGVITFHGAQGPQRDKARRLIQGLAS